MIGPDRISLEIAFIGNYNARRYPNVVTVRFTDLSPPYLAGVEASDRVEVLNRSVLGVDASLQVSSRDFDGALVGKLTLEGVRFRGKRRKP
ncbi:hypothetical protein OKA04_02280 [Luteolibacter flavescens]|uniref:Uncharacterized protein n=1 Tax=Luteolibacter flavescens TaxID=1859460 RepID=A0ABT3FJR3_9BACT|nr:hypothetical protein [Luteolibacter flavescens]MCW1883536.1 hypothetical protein [Luteolibacter flavescens]